MEKCHADGIRNKAFSIVIIEKICNVRNQKNESEARTARVSYTKRRLQAAAQYMELNRSEGLTLIDRSLDYTNKLLKIQHFIILSICPDCLFFSAA
jgi:hypothetical protein